MGKARDDYPDDREVPDFEDEDPWHQPEERPPRDEEPSPEGAVLFPYEHDKTYSMGFRGGSSFLSEPYFDSRVDMEMMIGSRGYRLERLLSCGFKSVTPKAGGGLAESLKDSVLFLKVGLEGRFYFSPGSDRFSPYLLAHIGTFFMYWTFENPLKSGSDIITDDFVGGAILAAGAGINFVDTETFRLGAAFIPEIHLYNSETWEGFRNDVFDYYATVRSVIEAAWYFEPRYRPAVGRSAAQ